MHRELDITYLPLSVIRPYDRNIKRHPQKQKKLLMENIKNYDFDVPIVVDEDYVIIKGHLRYAAAQELGMDRIPAIIRAGLTEAEKAAIRIADNRVAEFGEWDIENLIGEFEKFELDSITGFDERELEVLRRAEEDLGFVEPDTLEPSPIIGTQRRSYVVRFYFPNVEEATQFLQSLGIKDTKFKTFARSFDGRKFIDRGL